MKAARSVPTDVPDTFTRHVPIRAASSDVKDGLFLTLVVADVSFTEFLQQDKTAENKYRRKYEDMLNKTNK